MSSSARSSRTGIPLGLVLDVGGRIVFELCIKMITGRLPPPVLRHLRVKVIMPVSGSQRHKQPDPGALARFYSELLGWTIGREEPGTTILAAPEGSIYVVFQQATSNVRRAADPRVGTGGRCVAARTGR